MICCSQTVRAQEKPTEVDLVGTWTGVLSTVIGDLNVAITFTSNRTLAGTVEIDVNGEKVSGTIRNGKREGNAISFEAEISGGKMEFAGIVKGDEIPFDIIGTTGNKMKLLAKRQK